MLDVKEKLLLFLYENRYNHSLVTVNSVFEDFGLDIVDLPRRMLAIKSIIKEIESEGLINTDKDYGRIGDSSGGIWYDLSNTLIKAKLTTVKGQDYVKSQYINPQQLHSTINVHNNSGQITQTNTHHLEGNLRVNPVQIRNKPKKNNIIEYIVSIISLILTAIGVWLAYLQLK